MLTIDAGDGVILRDMLPGDAADLLALIGPERQVLARWLPWLAGLSSRGDCSRYIRYSREGNRAHRFLNLLVRVDGEAAGIACFFALEPSQRRAELGYWLGRRWQGRGRMTRACRALLTHGFERLDLYRVQIACGVDNLPSRALAERLGFRFEGVLRGREWLAGRPHDHAVYGLLASDWPRRCVGE